MTKKFNGKVVLVTGGSLGIGAAIAKKFAEEGADVAISYTSSAEKAEALVNQLKQEDIRAAAFKADQGDLAQAEELVDAVVKHFGRLDILVNNAGVFAGGTIDDLSIDVAALKRQLTINVEGVVATVRTAVKFLGDSSRIILIGSTLAERTTRTGIADYSATKAALIAYTKGWARDLGSKNITVNLVQCGPINTDMNPETSERAQVTKTRTALGRYGKPEEVAAAVVFLASPEAS